MRWKIALLLLIVYALGLGVGFAGPSADSHEDQERALDPVTAKIVAGLVVTTIVALTAHIKGTKVATVCCQTRLDGPHPVQDQTISPVAYDEDKIWFVTEDLDANTGVVSAPNHGVIPHLGWAEMHYHYSDAHNGWRPNPIAGNGKPWWLAAYPWPDGKPDRGKPNRTVGASVAAFGVGGALVPGVQKATGGEVVILPADKSAADDSSSTVPYETFASLYFSPEQFWFVALPGDRVRITPAGGERRVELFHHVANLEPRQGEIFPGFRGLSAELDVGIDDLLSTVLWNAPEFGDYPATTDPVDLTLSGAALELGAGEYDKYAATPPFAEKTKYELLQEYFADTSATAIVAPAQAQLGYAAPDLIFREVAYSDDPIAASGLSDSLAVHIPPAVYESNDGGDGTDLVGLVLGVRGSLEDAINLAAATPANPISAITDAMAVGETDSLELNFTNLTQGVVDNSMSNYIEDGPMLTTWDRFLAQDAFSESGVVDYIDLGQNNVRFDMAYDLNREEGSSYAPGDSIVIDAFALTPATELVAAPRMHYRLEPNPLFDPYRTSGVANAGHVDGTVCRDGNGYEIPDRWYFDLPDSGFFFPGDFINYFFEAEDDLARITLFPADTTGFSGLAGTGALVPGCLTVRALPSVKSTTQGDHPPILLWHDHGDDNHLVNWSFSLGNLGYRPGIDYDAFHTADPEYGGGNGLAGKAEPPQLAGYRTLLYAGADADTNLLHVDTSHGELEDGVDLLESWMSLGDKNLLLAAEHLAHELAGGGAGSLAFLEARMGVQFMAEDLHLFIGGQLHPQVAVTPGGTVVFPDTNLAVWSAVMEPPPAGGFDVVVAEPGAVRLAGFGDDICSPGPNPYSAATLYETVDGGRCISIPYGLSTILPSPCPGGEGFAGQPLATRTEVLSRILLYFGESPGGIPTVVAPIDVFTARAYPNPSNPISKIEYSMPRSGHLRIRIYNLRGQLVRQLVDRNVGPGPGFALWNGTDGSGAPVSSGVYFYTATGAGKQVRGKFALVK